MKKAKVLIYDGSFNGFLTAVFQAFEEKISVADIRKKGQVQNGLFSEVQTVFTQMDRAKRVWNGIENKSHIAIKNIYFAFLSESRDIELLLLKYIQSLFSQASDTAENSGEMIRKITHLSKLVEREKQRIETFVRFQSTRDNLQYAHISPNFDVLPLISRHFRSRYADQEWIIYDVRRKYGLHYSGQGVEIISLNIGEVYSNAATTKDDGNNKAFGFQELWNSYFKNTNIKSRINQKVHPQPAPRRYHKELQPRAAV